MSSEAPRYHWRQSWGFTRQPDGRVILDHAGEPMAEIPPEEWCSIVAAMSASGATENAYRAIQILHAGLQAAVHRPDALP